MGLLLKVLRFGSPLGTAAGERDDRSRRTAGTECEGLGDPSVLIAINKQGEHSAATRGAERVDFSSFFPFFFKCRKLMGKLP